MVFMKIFLWIFIIWDYFIKCSCLSFFCHGEKKQAMGYWEKRFKLFMWNFGFCCTCLLMFLFWSFRSKPLIMLFNKETVATLCENLSFKNSIKIYKCRDLNTWRNRNFQKNKVHWKLSFYYCILLKTFSKENKN